MYFLVSTVKPCLSRGSCGFTERREHSHLIRMLMFPRVLSKPKANSVSWCPFLLSTPSFFSVFTQLPVRKLLKVLNFWFPSCPENWNFANTVSSILLIGLELPPTRATERECYCPRGTGYLSGWRRQLNINFETLYTHKKRMTQSF